MADWKLVRVDRIGNDWESINVRSGPGLNTLPIGSIFPGQSVYLEETTTSFSINGYEWRRVKFDDDGDVYWVADELEYTVQIPADPSTIPAEDNLAAQVQLLSDRVDALRVQYETLNVAFTIDKPTAEIIAGGMQELISLHLSQLKVLSMFQTILQTSAERLPASD